MWGLSIEVEHMSLKTQFLHSLKLQFEMKNESLSIYLAGEIPDKLWMNELQHSKIQSANQKHH